MATKDNQIIIVDTCGASTGYLDTVCGNMETISEKTVVQPLNVLISILSISLLRLSSGKRNTTTTTTSIRA